MAEKRRTLCGRIIRRERKLECADSPDEIAAMIAADQACRP